MSLDIQALKDLVNTIENAEKSPEVIEWMQEITEKKAGLVDNMIKTFLDNSLKDLNFANLILRGLKKLDEFVPQQVLEQMRENKNFPKAIVKYICETNIKNHEGSAYLLLVEIFSAQNFSDVTDEKFVNCLIEALDIIADEKIFSAIVYILITISCEAKTAQESVVLRILMKHNNQRYFSEYLVHLLNKCHPAQIEKILRIFLDLYVSLKKTDFFYINDLKVVVDVVVREAANTSNEKIRTMFLQLLKAILPTGEYKKTNHRKADIKSLLEDILYSEVSEENKVLAKEILAEGGL